MTNGYIFEHEGMQYDPNGRADVAYPAAHNAALEAAELVAWQAKPDRFAVYIVENTHIEGRGMFKQPSYIATSWRGVKLGSVHVSAEWVRYGSRYGEPFKMRSIYVHGTNGVTYHGTYGSDWSQLCCIKRVKNTD